MGHGTLTQWGAGGLLTSRREAAPSRAPPSSWGIGGAKVQDAQCPLSAQDAWAEEQNGPAPPRVLSAPEPSPAANPVSKDMGKAGLTV